MDHVLLAWMVPVAVWGLLLTDELENVSVNVSAGSVVLSSFVRIMMVFDVVPAAIVIVLPGDAGATV